MGWGGERRLPWPQSSGARDSPLLFLRGQQYVFAFQKTGSIQEIKIDGGQNGNGFRGGDGVGWK